MDPQATDSLLLTACRPGRAQRTSLLLLRPEFKRTLSMKTPCSLYSWETLDSESHWCGHNLDPVHQRLMHMIEPDRTVCRCSRVTDCDEFKSPFFVCLTSFCSFCLWNRTFPLVFIKELFKDVHNFKFNKFIAEMWDSDELLCFLFDDCIKVFVYFWKHKFVYTRLKALLLKWFSFYISATVFTTIIKCIATFS